MTTFRSHVRTAGALFLFLSTVTSSLVAIDTLALPAPEYDQRLDGDTLGTDVLTRDTVLTEDDINTLPEIEHYLRSVLRHLGVRIKCKKKAKTPLRLYTEYCDGKLDRDEGSGLPDHYDDRVYRCVRLLLWINLYRAATGGGKTIYEYINAKLTVGDYFEKKLFTDFTFPENLADELSFLLTDTTFYSREVKDRQLDLMAHDALPEGIPAHSLYGNDLDLLCARAQEGYQEKVREYLWWRDMYTMRSVLAKILKQYLS